MSIELSTPVPAPDTRIGVRTCVELRVHGVAGASPVNMLELNPCRGPEAAEDEIVEWRQPHPQPQLRAWSWGSLTSGRWYQAIYLVLLPFMLANVAGWMLPPMQVDPDDAAPPATRSLRIRLAVLAVRTVGLLISIIFVLWAQLWCPTCSPTRRWSGAAAGRSGRWASAPRRPRSCWRRWSCSPGSGAARTSVTRTGPGSTGSTRRATPLLRRGRQHPMWNSPAINVVLRRLHLSAGLAIIALLAAWPAADLEQPWRRIGVATFTVDGERRARDSCWCCWSGSAWPTAARGGDLPHRGLHSRACRPERGRGLPPIGLVRWASCPSPAAGGRPRGRAPPPGSTPLWVEITRRCPRCAAPKRG